MTPAQKGVMQLLRTGQKLPRRIVAEMQRRLLRAYSGGLLVDFPWTVEEAQMIENWVYEVSVCVVMHPDVGTLASLLPQIRDPLSGQKQFNLSRSETLERARTFVRIFYEDNAPLIKYYHDVLVPCRSMTSRKESYNEVARKFGLPRSTRSI